MLTGLEIGLIASLVVFCTISGLGFVYYHFVVKPRQYNYDSPLLLEGQSQGTQITENQMMTSIIAVKGNSHKNTTTSVRQESSQLRQQESDVFIDSPIRKAYELMQKVKASGVMRDEEVHFISQVILANKETYELEFTTSHSNELIDDETKAWVVETFLQAQYKGQSNSQGDTPLSNKLSTSNNINLHGSNNNNTSNANNNSNGAAQVYLSPGTVPPNTRRASVGKSKSSIHALTPANDPHHPLFNHGSSSASFGSAASQLQHPHRHCTNEPVSHMINTITLATIDDPSTEEIHEGKVSLSRKPKLNVKSEINNQTATNGDATHNTITVSAATDVDHSVTSASQQQQSPDKHALATTEEVKKSELISKKSRTASVILKSIQKQLDHTAIQEYLEKHFCSWGLDIFEFDDLTDGHSLYFIGLHAFRKFGIIDQFSIPIPILQRWLFMMEKEYTNQPYHNSIHGADVLHAMVYLALDNPKIIEKMTMNEVFASIVAAVGHDVDHPGVNNAFLIRVRDKRALLYSDASVNENHHAAHVFLKTLEEDNLNIFGTCSNEDYDDIRKGIIRLILATDMSKHFQYLSQFKAKVEASSLDQLETPDSRYSVLEIAIKCADLSNPSKPFDICKKWVDLVMEEFFLQGDREKAVGLPISQFMDRTNTVIPKCQTGFIDILVAPLYEAYCTYNIRMSQEKIKPIIQELGKNRMNWIQVSMSNPDLSLGTVNSTNPVPNTTNTATTTAPPFSTNQNAVVYSSSGATNEFSGQATTLTNGIAQSTNSVNSQEEKLNSEKNYSSSSTKRNLWNNILSHINRNGSKEIYAKDKQDSNHGSTMDNTSTEEGIEQQQYLSDKSKTASVSQVATGRKSRKGSLHGPSTSNSSTNPNLGYNRSNHHASADRILDRHQHDHTGLKGAINGPGSYTIIQQNHHSVGPHHQHHSTPDKFTIRIDLSKSSISEFHPKKSTTLFASPPTPSSTTTTSIHGTVTATNTTNNNNTSTNNNINNNSSTSRSSYKDVNGVHHQHEPHNYNSPHSVVVQMNSGAVQDGAREKKMSMGG